MPFPLIAALFLSALSAGANTIGASQANSARDDALEAERIRQQGYDKEAAALNTQSQGRYKNYEGKQGKKSKELGDFFAPPAKGGGAPAPVADIMPGSSSDIVNREIAGKGAEAKAYTDQQGAALGDLRSFGDLLADTSRLQARDATGVGQIAGFKTGSAAVLPYELEEANKKGAMLKLFADILGGAGSVASGMNMKGGAPGVKPPSMEFPDFDPGGLPGGVASLYANRRIYGGPR